MSEIARQCRVKAEVYAEGAEDTYLYPLLMSAADTIEVLEEKVKVLLAKSGLMRHEVDDLADVRFRIKEVCRRLDRLEMLRDETKPKRSDEFDSFL